MRAVPASRYLVFFSIVVLGGLADLATKSWMFRELDMPGGRTRWIWRGSVVEIAVGLQTSLNEGALFGMGQGRVIEFAALSVVAVSGILFWLFYFDAGRDWLLTVALGCLAAGILGNLYDRLGIPGLRWNYANQWHEVGEPVHAVRDWILIMIGPYRWPNFNLADSLMVCGAGLIAWHALFAGREDGSRRGKAEEGGAKSEE